MSPSGVIYSLDLRKTASTSMFCDSPGDVGSMDQLNYPQEI